MARRLELHRTTVQRHLRKLEALGYVDRSPTIRATRGGWGRNRYGLNYPDVPSLKADEGGPDSPPDEGEANGVKPASEPVSATGSDAVSHAASTRDDASTTLATSEAMLRHCASDAAPDASTDAAPHAAQTIPMNYPKEKEPSGPAHVRSRRGEIIEYEDGSREANLETLGLPQAPSAQQRKSPTQAPTHHRETPRRPTKPIDHTTETAKQLAVVPGFDSALAWEAILALPDAVQVRLERGEIDVTTVVAELQNLDLGDTPKWQRARAGLSKVAGQ